MTCSTSNHRRHFDRCTTPSLVNLIFWLRVTALYIPPSNSRAYRRTGIATQVDTDAAYETDLIGSYRIRIHLTYDYVYDIAAEPSSVEKLQSTVLVSTTVVRSQQQQAYSNSFFVNIQYLESCERPKTGSARTQETGSA